MLSSGETAIFEFPTPQRALETSAIIAPASGGVATAQSKRGRGKLIVIGFVGGKVRANNEAHREVQLIQAFQRDYPRSIAAAIFANRDGGLALRSILHLLDEDGDGKLSEDERQAARIVLYGHSWGASEAITLAGMLNQLGIPVLLTVQVDSVSKPRQDDRTIPPNVREAINFYQSEGLLHGRSRIIAADPEKTEILGNFQSSYRNRQVSCVGYPWYARLLMRRHIEIENDPEVWDRIESLIAAKAK